MHVDQVIVIQTIIVSSQITFVAASNVLQRTDFRPLIIHVYVEMLPALLAFIVMKIQLFLI